MKTEDFIHDLATRTAPPAAKRSGLVLFGVVGLALAGTAFIAIAGTRPDLGAAWPSTLLKMGFGALCVVALLPMLRRAIGQDLRIGAAARGVIGVVTFAGIVSAVGIAMTAEPHRMALWTSGGIPDCLWQIPLIAVPIAATLLFAARRFAPTRIGVAALTVGAIAGALAAIPYSLFCPIDFAPYVATWYTAAFAICAALAGLMGARFLRW
jgi:hypothetical protein